MSLAYNRPVPRLDLHVWMVGALALMACSSSDRSQLEPVREPADPTSASRGSASNAGGGGGAGGAGGSDATGAIGGASPGAGAGGAPTELEDASARDADTGDAGAAPDASAGELRACAHGGACLGIFYHTWHCPARAPVHDLSKILAGDEEPGPVPSWH